MPRLKNTLIECLGLTGNLSMKQHLFRPSIGFRGELSLRKQLDQVENSGVIPHPYLSRFTTNMHENGSATDVTSQAGPGVNSQLLDESYLTYIDEAGSGRLGMLPTLAYRTDGKIVAIGVKASCTSNRSRGQLVITGWKEFSVLLINPDTLAIEQQISLPRQEARTSSISIAGGIFTLSLSVLIEAANSIWGWDEHKLYEDSSGGAYFTLDHKDRAIVPTANQEIWVVRFRSHRSPEITRLAIPGLRDSDGLNSISPTWMQDETYWFSTREGVVGIVSLTGDIVATHDIRSVVSGNTEETINNSIAVCADGVFVVSSHALYRFDYQPDVEGDILRWRSEYDRGSVRKCGQLPPRGSGTTPTLLGERFVAICDNAWNMQAHIFDRQTGATTGITRVFPSSVQRGAIPDGASACDNSIVAFKFTLYIGNTHCYKDPFSRNPTGGLTRIDVNPATGRVTHRWTRPNITIWSAVPKYSTQSNLIYIYAREDMEGTPWWHVKGIDSDGIVKVSIPIHQEEMVNGIEIGRFFRREKVDRYDNGWGPMYIGLDTWGSSSILLGMTQGLYRLRFS